MNKLDSETMFQKMPMTDDPYSFGRTYNTTCARVQDGFTAAIDRFEDTHPEAVSWLKKAHNVLGLHTRALEVGVFQYAVSCINKAADALGNAALEDEALGALRRDVVLMAVEWDLFYAETPATRRHRDERQSNRA